MPVGTALGSKLGTTLGTQLGQAPFTEDGGMDDITDGPLTGAGVPDTGDMAANFSTRWLPVQGRRLSISATWTGSTPTGTFSLECQFQDGTARVVPGAAAEFTANGQAQPAGNSSAVWNWSNIPGSKWRLTYTRSSGTGTLTSSFAQGS